MKNRLLKSATLSFLLLVGSCTLTCLGQTQASCPPPSAESHGTINILLGNENGLVAITDSMLSGGDLHCPGHQKLFQIDDTTIATMAGSYSRPGLAGENQHLDLWVPNVMTKFASDQAKLRQLTKEPISYALKFERFEELFAHELTFNLQAAVVADPTLDITQVESIELTLAGYDLDGSLKVGEVTLVPKQTSNGIEISVEGLPRLGNSIPTCELRGGPDSSAPYRQLGLTQPVVIRKGLFCEIAGLISVRPDRTIAGDEGVIELERILNAHAISPEPPAVRAYFESEASHTPLSLQQLADLAIALENLLAVQEAYTNKLRIGGPKYIAALHDGRVEGAPTKNEIRQGAGTALNGPQIYNTFTDCTGMRPGTKGFALSPPAENVQVGVSMKNCDGDIVDGAIYHNSTFVNGALNYAGTGPIHFANTNSIQGTELKIDKSVNLDRGDVKDLICHFPWKAVYHGPDEIHLSCK